MGVSLTQQRRTSALLQTMTQCTLHIILYCYIYVLIPLHMCPQNECPPVGYDSVFAVAGGDLNYSEVVVYDEARVVPSYLIVYSLSAQV